MSDRPIVVLDPGHGGARGTHNRGSSWNRAEGPNGLLEKNVAFDLALRVAARLGDHARVELTRSEQANPSLGERADVAKRLGASLFLSLHLNGAADPEADGTDVYFAHDAAPRARAFGDTVWRRLRSVTRTTRGGLGVRDLGTLLTARHSPRTAACLAEIAYLSNPRQAGALNEEGYRNQIADALADAIREHLAPPQALVQSLEIGDGSPFVTEAVTRCWAECERLRLAVSDAANPNRVVGERIHNESGVTVDANPYAGITRAEIEAVIRAGFSAHLMPEALLAIWAKEGSTRSVTSPVAIPQARSDASARTIFRSKVYYEDLGADHFIITTRRPGQDNTWDSSDAAAPRHETHFARLVAQLRTEGHLSEDIAAAINGELTVTRSGATLSVLPSTRFYALSLLLVDALWRKFRQTPNALLPSISDPMNYMQWNMGTASFGTFLTSAENHRHEPAHLVNGEPITIEQWALHTTPRSNEYRQPRTNAIKFHHYIESYRPIFAGSLNLIKPGIEDLQPGPNAAEVEAAAVIEALSTAPAFTTTNLIQPTSEFARTPLIFDEILGAFGAATQTTRNVATETEVRAQFPGFQLQDITPASTVAVPSPLPALARFENAQAVIDSPFFHFASGNLELVLSSVICYPADPADLTKLAPNSSRFPVAIVVMGNHAAVRWNGTPSGPVETLPVGTPAPPITAPGGVTTVPITITPFTLTSPVTIDSHIGYSNAATQNGGSAYLQEALAAMGIVSMSINTNGANQLNLGIPMRTEYIMQYLDQLRRFDNVSASPYLSSNPFFHKLDFNRVALIGHSRGGDAVVNALSSNARRRRDRYGIRAVVSISPTDMSGVLNPRGAPGPLHVEDPVKYLVLYGSHDGDVRGGGDGAQDSTASAFRCYDRSAADRAMVFIHGANHNRFNRMWNDEDDSVAAPLARSTQEALTTEYITGWLKFAIYDDPVALPLFNGTTANSSGTAVSLQWKFGPKKTIDRYQDAVPTRNTLGGAVASPSYVAEVTLDSENPADPALPHFHLPTFPHMDRVVKALPVSGTAGPLRESIPTAHQNFRSFTHLTFRVTKLYPTATAAAISGASLPDFSITLEDTAGHRKTVTGTGVRAANTLAVKPYFRTLFDNTALRNLTKCNLETWRVPLTLFTAAPGPVSLNAIRAVEFDFAAASGEPIYVDTLSLVRI